jgi:hypothetical protein
MAFSPVAIRIASRAFSWFGVLASIRAGYPPRAASRRGFRWVERPGDLRSCSVRRGFAARVRLERVLTPFEGENGLVKCVDDRVARFAGLQFLEEGPAVRKGLDSPLGLVRIDVFLLPMRVLPNPLG